MRQTVLDLFSAAGFLLMVAGIVLLARHQGLFTLSPVVIAVQFFAVCFLIWARVTFGRRSFHATARPTEGGLVTTGPYRFVRHPIYASVLYFVFAGVAGNLSLINVGFGLVTLAGAAARIFCEETLVRVRYPEYEEYARKTSRLIPFVF